MLTMELMERILDLDRDINYTPDCPLHRLQEALLKRSQKFNITSTVI